ncbi:hypothetical protein E3N88_08727 [Mikania micrantha]|uniref:Cytochrome c oxidase copper chaperone n=1 Tax=Mikania micrantha TaxID=192012 RepID=A0A5N6PJ07_9ASTR|nr:hypothetical protein E3N88_08727 [Mikania micrantha]
MIVSRINRFEVTNFLQLSHVGPTVVAASETKPKKKICCACPDTKKLRDECIVEHGETACTKWIEAHRLCLSSAAAYATPKKLLTFGVLSVISKKAYQFLLVQLQLAPHLHLPSFSAAGTSVTIVSAVLQIKASEVFSFFLFWGGVGVGVGIGGHIFSFLVVLVQARILIHAHDHVTYMQLLLSKQSQLLQEDMVNNMKWQGELQMI